MNNFPNLGPERASEFLKDLAWATIKGLGLGFSWAIKLFMPIWLPLVVIFFGWIALVIIFRYGAGKIVRGEFYVSFDWLKDIAQWLSCESGGHQSRWGVVVIGLVVSILSALITKLF